MEKGKGRNWRKRKERRQRRTVSKGAAPPCKTFTATPLTLRTLSTGHLSPVTVLELDLRF